MRGLNLASYARIRQGFVLSGCVLLIGIFAPAGSAADVTVEATRREDALEVVCKALLDARLETVWQTLTDYGRLAEFIPGMRRSRVVERRGAVVVVEQAGEAGFFVFRFPIEVTIASTERPPHALEARMIKGNLKKLEGAYRIEPQAGGRILLSWSGTIEALSMPPLLGELVLRSNIEDQFRGMVQEIDRREALRRAREAERKE